MGLYALLDKGSTDHIIMCVTSALNDTKITLNTYRCQR